MSLRRPNRATVRMHRAGRPLIPGGFRRPARWRGATCSGAQRGTLMGVDSFDAAGRRDRLAAQLAELEAATALPPKLAAQLAELSASLEACRPQLPALGPVAEASQAWVREMGRDAIRDWRRDLDRREQLDAALIELAAERRHRASGSGAHLPAPGAAEPVPGATPAAAPVPPPTEAPAVAPWTHERIALRLAEIKNQVPKIRAPVPTLLQEMQLPYSDATRQMVRRAVKAHEEASKGPGGALATVWPGSTKPLKRRA